MDTIETERLRIRPWTMEDLEDFYAYCKDPDVGPNAGWKPHESIGESKGILESWVRGSDTDFIWALEDKESGKAVGSLGLHEEDRRPKVPGCKMLGYVLSKEYWGKGLMTEAANAIIDYAFRELKLRILTVNHFTFNRRSRSVIEKCGFHYEGTMRQGAVLYDGGLVDICLYSMTAAEYYLLRAKQAGFSLALPEELSKEEFLEFHQEWDGGRMVPSAVSLHGLDYEAWLRKNISYRVSAPEGFVTGTAYFLLDRDRRPVGALDLRHELNQNLLQTGGHIGYGIRPSCRGRGYAPYMLALGLEKARERGIGRVLVTCDDDNPASAATIEACGGILENKFPEEDGNLVRRYWIAL